VPEEEVVGERGILTQAKSREGSQISATALGRYPPTVAAKDLPTVCDVRRIKLPKVGFIAFRSGVETSAVLAPNSSDVSSLAKLLFRLCEEPVGRVGPDDTLLLLLLGAPKRKMWTVSVADETLSKVDVELNDMLYIFAGIEPLLNWYSFCASGMEKTRMMVPFSEAVASRVPSLFRAMQDSGELCASITLTASIFVASYMSTSPLVGAMWSVLGGACEGGWKVAGAALVGSGYTR
jgi:hypothetical protein